MARRLECPRCGTELPDAPAPSTGRVCPGCGAVFKTKAPSSVPPSAVPPSSATAGSPSSSAASRTQAAVDDETDDYEPIVARRSVEEAEMDMTPMVDIVFQLLIFFMVTASFALQRSLEIPKPDENRPSNNASQSQNDIDSDPDYVIVRVDAIGVFFVLAVDWENEEEAPSQQELLLKLRRARAGDSTGNVPHKMMVKAHGDAPHGRVVMAIDAGVSVNMTEVKLQTVEDDE